VAEGKRITVFFDRNSCEFVGLTSERIDELKQAFPGVNVLGELMTMKDWLLSSKGSKSLGSLQFIMNWLKRAPASSPVATSETDSRLQPLISSYLEELWTKNSHIIAINRAS
jgi:hypothetical protein